MSSCFIFHLHYESEPSAFTFLDIGKNKDYFETQVEKKTSLFSQLKSNASLKANGYLSGTFLEAIAEDRRQLSTIKSLVESNQLELLGGLYYHSLSSLFSKSLFDKELTQHLDLVSSLFGVKPKGFINTAGIFSDDLIEPLIEKGFEFAVVPKVRWFQEPHIDYRVFESKNQGFNLILAGDEKPEENKQSVRYEDGFTNLALGGEDKTCLCSEFIKTHDESIRYSLPSLAVIDQEGSDIGRFFGNALQKQIFETLKEITPDVLKANDPKLIESLFKFSSAGQFEKISQQSKHDIRYHHYTWLINCLTDMELKFMS